MKIYYQYAHRISISVVNYQSHEHLYDEQNYLSFNRIV